MPPLRVVPKEEGVEDAEVEAEVEDVVVNMTDTPLLVERIFNS